MSVTLNGTNGLTFNDGSTQNTGATGFGFKNKIINGAMMIDQRNAGASVTPANGAYTIDRWFVAQTVASKFSVQQNAGSVTPPAGFTNYLGATSLSAYTVGATDQFAQRQIIEGYNVADLAYGTASAKAITLSFQVYSSLTGTFGGALYNYNANKSYVFSYSIASANTWTQVSITVPGDTASALTTNNGSGLLINLSLGYGSTYSTSFTGGWVSGFYGSVTGATSVVGTNGATFYITGVQLEKGSTATSFDYRPYGTELALCQRYYWKQTSANGLANSNYTRFGSCVSAGTSADGTVIVNPVPMRASPTATISTLAVYDGTSVIAVTGITTNYSSPYILCYTMSLASSTTAGKYLEIISNNNTTTAYVDASAEL